MGKKTVKPSKKKSTAKKKASAPKKMATQAKSTAKPQKTTAKAKGAVKKTAASTKAQGKKTVAAKKKAVSAEKLILRKFGQWMPETVFAPGPDTDYEAGFSAPAFEANKGVLLRTFDYASFPEKPKEPVSLRELISRKFGVWTPGTLFAPSPDADYAAGFSAPAFEADKGVLLRTFDYENFPVKAEAPAPPEEDKTPEIPAASKEPTPVEDKAPEAPPVPREPVSVKELISRKFDTWTPETLFAPTPDAAYGAGFSAPAFEADKAILLRAFDYENFPTEPETTQETGAIYEPPVKKRVPKPPKKGLDPMERMIRLAIAGFALVIAIMLIASSSNSSKYYVRPAAGALEIWQGNFAPMGECLLIALPGAQPLESVKDAYTKEDAFPIVFNYYIEKADALLETPGLPDFKAVKAYLNEALSFGTTVNVREAYARLKNIDLIVLMNLADIAASKGTAAGLETALVHLNKAAAMVNKAVLLEVDSKQTEFINRKLELIKEMSAKLEASKAEESPEAPAESTEVVKEEVKQAETKAGEAEKAEAEAEETAEKAAPAETEKASSESAEAEQTESAGEKAETPKTESAEAASDHK